MNTLVEGMVLKHFMQETITKYKLRFFQKRNEKERIIILPVTLKQFCGSY